MAQMDVVPAVRALTFRLVVFLLFAGIVAVGANMLVTGDAAAAVDESAQPPIPDADLPIGDVDGDGDVDLDDLVSRISDSKAIVFLTNLSLKRDIDGFERALKSFHDGDAKSTLAKLHERYDLLVHKLLSLLQEKDPELAGRAQPFCHRQLVGLRLIRRGGYRTWAAIALPRLVPERVGI